MEDFPTQKITIYHKDNNSWTRYVKDASYRDTSILNHNKNGDSSTDNVLIRIFDIDGYNSQWYVNKGDVIINREVNDIIISKPLTELSNQYGTDNVHRVTSIDKFLFNDAELPNHIKIGCV